MEKKYSVKQEMLAIVIIPTVILTAVMLITGIQFMKAGMEKEILTGLLSSAYAYRDIAILHTDRLAGDNDIETELKKNSGYDFTWFDGEVRKNSSLGDSVIGTRAADTVMKEVFGLGKVFTSTNTMVAGTPFFVAYVPVTDDSGKVIAMAFTGVSRQSVKSQISKYILVMLFIGGACLAIAIIVATMVAKKMAEAISLMNGSIRHLAKNKYVKINKYLDRGDEIGQALVDTNSLIDTLQAMSGQIKSIAEIYITVHEINLVDDTYIEVQCRDKQLTEAIGKSGTRASQVIYAQMAGHTDPGSCDEMLDFVDLKRLNERLSNAQTITAEFLNTNGEWRRARFIVSDRSETKQIQRVMFLVEDIDIPAYSDSIRTAGNIHLKNR